MADVTATEAARNFADLLDAVEHHGEHFSIVRRGKVIAQLEPVSRGRGEAVKGRLGKHQPDPDWSDDLEQVRALVVLDERR